MSVNPSDPVLEVATSALGQRNRASASARSAGSADILALGRVLADSTGIRSAYRCQECATEFLLPHPERRVGPPDRRARRS